MRGLVLLFTLHFGDEHPSGDRWFSADKAKHFFTAALVQSVAFGGLRSVGMSKHRSLVGATVVTTGVSVGKEVFDWKTGGDPSLKDLTWDLAGMAAMTGALRRTEP